MAIGGGELQAGLTLGLGGGDVHVTAVDRQSGGNVGFTVETTATDFFYIVSTSNDTCSAATTFSGKEPITRVDFCTGGSGC